MKTLKNIYLYLQNIFYQIYDLIFPVRYQLTPKGKAFLKYLKDKESGKNVYIEEYEKLINELK